MKRHWILSLLAAAGAGAVWFLAQEPLALGVLGWLALAPLFWAILSTHRLAFAALLGFMTGVVFFTLEFWWVFGIGWMAGTALIVGFSLFPAAASTFAYLVRRSPIAPVALGGAWVATELVRDRWPWGGFGWASIGISQANVPGARWLAGTIGASGLTFLCAFLAAWIAHAIVTGRRSWASLTIVGLAVASFAIVDIATSGDAAPGTPVDIAVVQAHIPRPERDDQDAAVLASLERQTRALAERGRAPDLILWPENALGYYVPAETSDRLAALAREIDTPILAGRSVGDLPGRRSWNYVDLIDTSGRRVQTYQKRHPLPFGEYVPVPSLLDHVSSLNDIPFDMIRGRRATVFEVAGAHIGIPICFESVFARDVRAFAEAGADLIVVATNDSSFRTYIAEQHLAHSRMRALELRQWTVHGGLSGVSAIIAPDGRITARAGHFEETTMRGVVRARRATSLYFRTGDVFAFIFAAAALLALAIRGATGIWTVANRVRRRS